SARRVASVAVGVGVTCGPGGCPGPTLVLLLTSGGAGFAFPSRARRIASSFFASARRAAARFVGVGFTRGPCPRGRPGPPCLLLTSGCVGFVFPSRARRIASSFFASAWRAAPGFISGRLVCGPGATEGWPEGKFALLLTRGRLKLLLAGGWLTLLLTEG